MNPSYPFPVIIIELISHFYVYVPIGNELDSPPYTFFLLNGDMELNRNR
jgi:hypothetical protein